MYWQLMLDIDIKPIYIYYINNIYLEVIDMFLLFYIII